ncbi:MAG TPA: reverse transcriptase-like protein [Solirubrobacterales bacterium]|nr:reverse transcriptase-like protein [Solirubrobacterales bacterium]
MSLSVTDPARRRFGLAALLGELDFLSAVCHNRSPLACAGRLASLGDATNNVAEYKAARNALRAAADAGATSAHVRMDSQVVFGHLTGASRARAEHLIQLKKEVEAQKARYSPGRVTFARIPREQNGVADELAKDGARTSKALSADRRR